MLDLKDIIAKPVVELRLTFTVQRLYPTRDFALSFHATKTVSMLQFLASSLYVIMVFNFLLFS